MNGAGAPAAGPNTRNFLPKVPILQMMASLLSRIAAPSPTPAIAGPVAEVPSAGSAVPAASAGSAADRFALQGPSAEQLLGLPMASYLGATGAYREEFRQRGIESLLARAERHGGIPDRDPVWLCFSPIGWHCKEFRGLAGHPQAGPYFERCHPLRIACYGAGLHDEAEYLRYRYPERGLGPLDEELRRRLRTFQEGLLGPIGKCSHEPRELLLLFLRDERPGSIDVFDNQPGLAQELERPTLPLIDCLDLYYRSDEPVRHIVDSYRYLSRGREVEIGSHLIPSFAELGYLNFALTPQEMEKIRHRPLDLATDRMDDVSRFHLSVWLESEFFFDEPLRWIILSKIVRAMEPGSYLLANALRKSDEKFVAFDELRSFAAHFGLEFVGLAPNHMGLKGSVALYRRVSDQESPVVRRLAGL